MKKVLIATTALVAVAAAPAFAKIEGKVGGYYTGGIALISDDGSEVENAIQSYQDFEFEIKGKFEMDNGITAHIDLEYDADTGNGNHNNSRSDDITAGLSGSFGMVEFGMFAQDENTGTPIPQGFYSGGGVDGSDMAGKMGLGNNPQFQIIDATFDDGTAVAYVTPSISGLKIAGRYMFDSSGEGQTTADSDNHNANETYTVSVNYGGTFGDAKVAAGIAYVGVASTSSGHALQGANEIDFGASVEMSGFKVTAAYAAAEMQGTGLDTDTSYGVSAGYTTGPWNLGVGYATRENAAGVDGNGSSEISLGANYAMGPGVKLFAGINFGTEENATTEDNDSTGGALGMTISF